MTTSVQQQELELEFIDTPLVYGDYYFLEALVRFRDSSRSSPR